MTDARARFSRTELKNFLRELANQVENGKVGIEIPGYSKGNQKITPEQPVDVLFKKGKDERRMTIEIDLKDRRNI